MLGLVNQIYGKKPEWCCVNSCLFSLSLDSILKSASLSLFGLVPFSQTLRNKNSNTSGRRQCLWCHINNALKDSSDLPTWAAVVSTISWHHQGHCRTTHDCVWKTQNVRPSSLCGDLCLTPFNVLVMRNPQRILPISMLQSNQQRRLYDEVKHLSACCSLLHCSSVKWSHSTV